MSNDKDLLQKYQSQIRNKENNIKNLQKTLRSYGVGNSQTREDVEFSKSQLECELKNVKIDILNAGAKYDSSLVVALKNKEGRIKTKLNEINDIFVLLDKIEVLKTEISNLEEEIINLGYKINLGDNEREQMNIVLKALRKNYSCEDAARLANIELKRMVNWIHEGRNKTNKNKIYFFKQYSRINHNKNLKIAKILKHLKNGKTKDEACKLSYVSIKAFDAWYNYGRLGKDKINVDFYNEVKLIEQDNGKKLMCSYLDESHKPRDLNIGIQNV